MGSGASGGGQTANQRKLERAQVRELSRQEDIIDARDAAIRRARTGRNMLITTSELGITSKPSAGPVSSLVGRI